jgi:predicted transglutaminase-like cysteine proteinase
MAAPLRMNLRPLRICLPSRIFWHTRICWNSAILIFILGLTLKLYPTIVFADSIILNEQELQSIAEKYGNAAETRLRKWRELIDNNRESSVDEKLVQVNHFFNQLEFISDDEHWGARDYWATPVEFMATNGGDCEDFSIAKYFTLREMGVPIERMRITYVKALTLDQAHMVLTYYATPDAEPIILDNLEAEIKPASQREDLLPVYSFNGDNLWLSLELTGRGQLVGESSRIKIWTKLIRRIQQQKADHSINDNTGAQ